MNWRWLLVLPLLWAAWDHWQARPIVHPPGVLASAAPVQSDLGPTPPQLAKPGYQIVPLQSFSLVARVLGKERYRFDEGADISPLDLALGWGPMSDEAILDAFDISQGGRFYFWHVKQFPIPRREIETHSANMHMIPATEEIEHRLSSIRPGHVLSQYVYDREVLGCPFQQRSRRAEEVGSRVARVPSFRAQVRPTVQVDSQRDLSWSKRQGSPIWRVFGSFPRFDRDGARRQAQLAGPVNVRPAFATQL